jgi:hypothetical protein
MHRVFNRSIQRNPSFELIQQIRQLPNLKKIECQIEEDDFILKYFENKKRVSIKYKSKNSSSAGLSSGACHSVACHSVPCHSSSVAGGDL